MQLFSRVESIAVGVLVCFLLFIVSMLAMKPYVAWYLDGVRQTMWAMSGSAEGRRRGRIVQLKVLSRIADALDLWSTQARNKQPKWFKGNKKALR